VGWSESLEGKIGPEESTIASGDQSENGGEAAYCISDLKCRGHFSWIENMRECGGLTSTCSPLEYEF
jgi:hypothetical protein